MKMLYVCEGCGEQYDREVTARSCEAKAFGGKQVAEVGDIVLGSYGFGWYDGDKRWISNPNVALKKRSLTEWKKCPNGDGNCFASCCTYGFYYVVTAIDTHEHRVRYHLATRAMKKDCRSGYTYNEHHIRPEKVVAPSNFLMRSGRGLVGQKASVLL